jgi:hypothetical protein
MCERGPSVHTARECRFAGNLDNSHTRIQRGGIDWCWQPAELENFAGDASLTERVHRAWGPFLSGPASKGSRKTRAVGTGRPADT